MDQVVLLTPLVVLAVVLLLGFAGCDVVFGLDEVRPPKPFLTLRVRVPKTLEVRKIVFLWDLPSGVGDSKTFPLKPTPTAIDGDDNVFDHELTGEPDNGVWTVECQVTVAGGSQQGVSASGTFTLDGSLGQPVATFQAMGDAATLAVAYVGVS